MGKWLEDEEEGPGIVLAKPTTMVSDNGQYEQQRYALKSLVAKWTVHGVL